MITVALARIKGFVANNCNNNTKNFAKTRCENYNVTERDKNPDLRIWRTG